MPLAGEAIATYYAKMPWNIPKCSFLPHQLLHIAAHEGGDADTNAAVAGALLGEKFGYSNIPQRWVEGLVYRQELGDKIDRLMALMSRN